MKGSSFSRLINDNENDPPLCYLQVVRTSDNLYGSNIFLALEMAKELTRPVSVHLLVVKIDKKLVIAQSQLEAKHKFTMILRPDSIADSMAQAGNLI